MINLAEGVPSWLDRALVAFSEGMCPECFADHNRESFCFPCKIRWDADFEKRIITSNYSFPGGGIRG